MGPLYLVISGKYTKATRYWEKLHNLTQAHQSVRCQKFSHIWWKSTHL